VPGIASIGQKSTQNGYKADYGILLDMVGAPGATFYKEEISMYYAAHVVNKVWDIAQNLGYGQYFLNEKMGAITDDHLYVNRIAGIPSIDIIQYDKFAAKGFGQFGIPPTILWKILIKLH
jgi:hypothetical protein